jgi:hypothetical protein
MLPFPLTMKECGIQKEVVEVEAVETRRLTCPCWIQMTLLPLAAIPAAPNAEMGILFGCFVGTCAVDAVAVDAVDDAMAMKATSQPIGQLD